MAMRRAAFIYSSELEKYRYPPEHPFNTIRAQKTREILNSMGLLTGPTTNEIAPEPALNVAAAHEIASGLENTLHEQIARPVNITVHIEPDMPELRK